MLLSGDQIWYGLDMGLINTFSRLVALRILSFQGLVDASGIEGIFGFWGGDITGWNRNLGFSST